MQRTLFAAAVVLAAPALADPLPSWNDMDAKSAMLESTAAGAGPRFGMLIHHTDGEREFACGCEATSECWTGTSNRPRRAVGW